MEAPARAPDAAPLVVLRAAPAPPVTFRQLCATAAVAGGATMGIEMAASRLLAPAFGTSELVWANLIGVILLSLAAGYRVGGWQADRRPGPGGMYGALMAAGVLDLLLPLAGRWAIGVLGAGITATPVSVILLSLCAVLAVIAPPVFLLAVATPFALRLAVQVQPPGRAGTAVGALEAWATAGSIAGTFLPALVTIPFLGVNATLVGLGALLIVTGALGLRRPRLLGLLVLPLCVGLLSSGVVRPVPGLLYEAQSLYQFIQVYRQGTMTYLTVNEGAGIQSAWNSASPLTGLYYDAYMLLPGLRPGTRRRVLVIGSGGGTILRQYAEVLSGRYRLDLTGVEIDPKVAALGPRYFGLSPALAADVHVEDGRTFLNALPASAPPYDIVIVDAYSQELYIPYELATVQFYDLVREHLAPGGIVALNVNALSPQTPLLLSLERTLRAAFPHVYAAKVGGAFNYLVAGSTAPIDPSRLLAAGGVPPLLAPLASQLVAGWAPASGSGGWLLTDNRAPLDYLTDLELLQGIRDTVQGHPVV